MESPATVTNEHQSDVQTSWWARRGGAALGAAGLSAVLLTGCTHPVFSDETTETVYTLDGPVEETPAPGEATPTPAPPVESPAPPAQPAPPAEAPAPPLAPPAPPAPPAVSDFITKHGVSGDQVKIDQSDLIKVNCLKPKAHNGKPNDDGKAGQTTKRAIGAAEGSQGMTQDYVYDKALRTIVQNAVKAGIRMCDKPVGNVVPPPPVPKSNGPVYNV